MAPGQLRWPVLTCPPLAGFEVTTEVEELAYSNILQVEALVESLSEKGFPTKEEVLERVKKLQTQAAKKMM